MVSGGLLIGCRNDRNERFRLDSVNRSLENANAVIADQSSRISNDLMREAQDPRYHNTLIWVPLADSVRKLSAEVNEFLDSLIDELRLHSENAKDRDRDAVRRIIEKEGKGSLLYDRLIAYRKAVFNVFTAENLESYREARIKELEEIKKVSPINLSLSIDTAGLTSMRFADWEAEYFSIVSYIVARVLLNKIKNDVLSTGIGLIRYCSFHVTRSEGFDQYSVLIGINSEYAKKGDSMEITAGVGAFSLMAQPTFTINGVVVPPEANGAALYKMRITGAKGKHYIPVKVEFFKPDGTKTIMTKEIKYTVID
jgi:hypothetical protein